MTVKELIKELENCDQDSIVILQKDAEGNGYSPLAGSDNACNYQADSTWSGDVGYKEITPELKKAGYGNDRTGCSIERLLSNEELCKHSTEEKGN